MQIFFFLKGDFLILYLAFISTLHVLNGKSGQLRQHQFDDAQSIMKLVGTDEGKDTDRESNTLQNLKLHQATTLPSINKSFPHLW